MSDLPFDADPESETARSPVRSDRPCRRHDWIIGVPDDPMGPPTLVCKRCHRPKDEAKSKMGRKVGQRSKREERSLAKGYGGTREGHKGGATDVATGLFAMQSKVSPHWFVERYWLELCKLPRTGGRVPLLIVSDGRPGRHVRRMVIVDERDWRDLHGEPE